MIERADIAVVGGGIMGASTAFNLAKDTRLSVVLIEKNRLASGSTGLSAAIVRHYYSTELMVRSAIESRKVFAGFETAVGEPLEFVQNSFLAIDSGELARTSKDRVSEMRRYGLESELLSLEDITRRFPFVRAIEGEAGIFDKEAGFVPDPTEATRIYARQASKHGATVYEDTPLTGIRVESGAVKSVVTPTGEIAVDYVVNASGPWGARVAKMVGLDYPITAERQQLIDFKPAGGWPLSRPTISDRRNITYLKPSKGGIAHTGGHYYGKECDPDNFDGGADREFIADVTPKLVDRFPELAGASIVSSFSGLYETTPDKHPLVGETEVKGFIMCAGWSGHGFKHGPYFGWLLKELVEKGSAPVDISMLKPERFKTGELVRTEYSKANKPAPYG